MNTRLQNARRLNRIFDDNTIKRRIGIILLIVDWS